MGSPICGKKDFCVPLPPPPPPIPLTFIYFSPFKIQLNTYGVPLIGGANFNICSLPKCRFRRTLQGNTVVDINGGCHRRENPSKLETLLAVFLRFHSNTSFTLEMWMLALLSLAILQHRIKHWAGSRAGSGHP